MNFILLDDNMLGTITYTSLHGNFLVSLSFWMSLAPTGDIILTSPGRQAWGGCVCLL